jgi:hypothetical protein
MIAGLLNNSGWHVNHKRVERIWRWEGLKVPKKQPKKGRLWLTGKCYKRHRATEYLDFLRKLDAAMPEEPKVHLVMDNSATHKTPKIKAWLARRPHWHVQFTPTSASWINQVERWFAELTRSPAGWLASDNLVAGRPGL